MSIYQEEDSSQFTHNGKLYSLNKLLQESHNNDITEIDTAKVEWILKDSYINKDRFDKADLTTPILVIYDDELKLWVVLDGTHRVAKAVKLKQKTLICVQVNESQLNKALIRRPNNNLPAIKAIAKIIRENNLSFFQYGGFGYCAYFSQLLKNELDKINITSTVLLGEYFNETIEAETCKKFIEKTILTFPDQDDGSFYYDVKKHYIKRKRLPQRLGHAVLLINNEIFDITSGQFNLPESYPIILFKHIWRDLYTAEIDLKSQHQFGIRNNSKVKYSHEDISPSYLKW